MSVSVSQAGQVLQDLFGLTDFRAHQKEVIDNVLAGRHTLALLPTGYGKSLCYQVPSQMLPGLSLVVSPLIALMRDQVVGLTARGIKSATYLNSTVSEDEQFARVDSIRKGLVKLLYVAPERFESSAFRSLLKEVEVSLLVIDEAHCISQWGHDFRPQYRSLAGHLTEFQASTVLALTATATPGVRQDIVDSLALPNMAVIVGELDRPNLHLEVVEAKNAAVKDGFLLQAIARETEPVVVYVSSRKESERVAQFLKSRGFKSGCYHAGMTGDARHRVQKQFENEDIKVIACTTAFGMGIDKGNIRRVIHYNLPSSLESYFQEAGRAGRDGKPAVCTLLFQKKDIFTQKWLLGKNYPDDNQVTDIYRLIKGAGLAGVRWQELLGSLNIEAPALNGALDHLRSIKLVDVDSRGTLYDGMPDRIDPAIDLQPLRQRKYRDQDRLEKMIGYATTRTCRRRSIIAYFGQRLSDSCTGCDICHPELFYQEPVDSGSDSSGTSGSGRGSARSGDARRSGTGSPYVLSDNSDLRRDILELVRALPGRVGRTSFAKILRGSKAKDVIEAGLDRQETYGKYAALSNDDVLGAIDGLIDEGLIRKVGSMYPKLSLSQTGKKEVSTSQ